MKIDYRIAMVYQRKIVWEGSTGSMQNAGNPFTGQFIKWKVEGHNPVEVFSG